MKEIPLHLGLEYLFAAGLWPPRYSLPKERHRWWNSTILYSVYSIIMIGGMMICATQTLAAFYAFDDLNAKEKASFLI